MLEKRLIKCVFYLLLFFLPALLIDAEETRAAHWKLRKDKDGIQVYSRKVEGSRHREFKGVVEFDATLASSLALLDDASACTDWVYRCTLSRVLERLGPLERIVYQANDLPFPAATRDIVFRVTLAYKAGSIRVNLQSVPDYLDTTSYVRIRDSYGFYLLEQLDVKRLRLTWVHYIDPAGILPAFVVNLLLTDVPFTSLKNFRDVVKRQKYASARFIYDETGTPVNLFYGEM